MSQCELGIEEEFWPKKWPGIADERADVLPLVGCQGE
jgi:hypothetical protein